MKTPKPITYDSLLAEFRRQDAEREVAPAVPTAAMREALVSHEVVNDDPEDHGQA